jgi:hypothetical protein
MNQSFIPRSGDLLWCHFPTIEHRSISAKARIVLVLEASKVDGIWHVTVAKGTSKRINERFQGEFVIDQHDGEEVIRQTGIIMDTKFSLARIETLPLEDRWFSVAPWKPCGNTPKIGRLPVEIKRISTKLNEAARSAGLI